MRIGFNRMLFSISAAWITVYAAYLTLVVSTDMLFGAQQFLSTLLFESRRVLALQMLDIVADSWWITLPSVALAVVVTLTGPGSDSIGSATKRALVCAFALVAVLLWQGFTAFQCAIFTAAFLAGIMVAFLLAQLNRRVPA